MCLVFATPPVLYAVSLLAAAIPIVSAESKEALNILIFVPVDPLSLVKILSACDFVSDLKTPNYLHRWI